MTIARSGGGFSVGNVRTYDVWGGVRSGASTGGPRGRYVANLGHVQDDESGLIYMRARYYEPGSGRFLSEDRAMDGRNYYIYADSNSLINIDFGGDVSSALVSAAWAGLLAFLAGTFEDMWNPTDPILKCIDRIIGDSLAALAAIQATVACLKVDLRTGMTGAMIAGMALVITAGALLAANAIHQIQCLAYLAMINGDDRPEWEAIAGNSFWDYASWNQR